MEQVEDHKIDSQDGSALKNAERAGKLLSEQASAAGTVGADTYAGRTSDPLKTYSTVDAVLADEKSRLDGNQDHITAFALPAADRETQDKQIKDTIDGLEDQLGHKLNYLWFDDDSGKAQVFLLGARQKPSDAPAPAAAACVPFDSLVDNSANLQMNLPRGTTNGEAGKVIQDRQHRAQLALEGIPTNATEAEVKAIQADRDSQIKALEDRLPAPGDLTREQSDSLSQSVDAIKLGLSPDSSAADIGEARGKYKLQSDAIHLGLDQNSSADDVKAVEARINATPDSDLNLSLGLPIYTTRADALDQSMQWIKDSERVSKGLDPNASSVEIQRVNSERAAARAPYADVFSSSDSTPDQKAAAELAMYAIDIGLPPDSTKQQVMETTALYARQSSAVILGLPRDASDQAIKEAQERDENNVPNNLCEVKQ